MSKMHWMLISVADREIMTEQFKTFEEAHNQMMKEFCECSQIDPADCTEEESECDSEFGYCKWNAYVSDGVNHEDYDWLIVGLDEGENIMNGVWLATMYSESYEWIAVGKTKEQAIDAIIQEWNNSDWRESMTTEELNNEYGIYCRFMKFGICEWN